VSEYQYYEFLAVDHELDDDQQAELRALSTRADITATRFTNDQAPGTVPRPRHRPAILPH
jgi:hypothetical protein